MASENTSLSEKESLNLIHQMINRARGDLKNSSFYFLLWGWVVLAASLGHFVLLIFSSLAHPEWAWSIIAIAIIGSVMRGFRERKNKKTTSYLENINAIIWITFLVNYAILVVFMSQINFNICPLVLVMVASSVYLSGSIIKFAPLKWGAIFIWLMAIGSFIVTLPYQLLVMAAAVIGGYLIPGYMLKKREV